MEKGPFWESDDSKDWRKFCGFTTEHSYIPIVRAPCASAVVVKPIASCCLSLPGLVNKQFAIAITWPLNYSGFTH